MTFADFQLVLFYGVAPCSYFELKAMGGQEARNSHKNCSGYFPKVFYSLGLPTPIGRFSGTKSTAVGSLFGTVNASSAPKGRENFSLTHV